MKINAAQVFAGIVTVMLLIPLGASPQVPETQQAPPSAQYSIEQYDQLVAPIALYPDPLLAQILMAATYPLEVVQADRWLQNPDNATLQGEQLATALEQQPWDPSVKSLIPFPQILRMMDDNLTWTEQLGDAFLAGQDAVMDSVQRLRQKAQAQGTLRSTSQEVVSTQDSEITIEPPNPETVYVPVYDPDVAYGIWPYDDYPPYYFPGYFGVVVVGSSGWFGYGINLPLWGWNHWDWGRHRIDVDSDRFNSINAHHRPSIESGAWRHDPSHRGGVPYRDAGTRTRFQGETETRDVRQSYRGYPTVEAPQSRPTMSNERGTPRAFSPPQTYHAPLPPDFESFGRGTDVRIHAIRGHESRQSTPTTTGGGGGRSQQPEQGAEHKEHSGGRSEQYAPGSEQKEHR